MKIGLDFIYTRLMYVRREDVIVYLPVTKIWPFVCECSDHVTNFLP